MSMGFSTSSFLETISETFGDVLATLRRESLNDATSHPRHITAEKPADSLAVDSFC